MFQRQKLNLSIQNNDLSQTLNISQDVSKKQKDFQIKSKPKYTPLTPNHRKELISTDEKINEKDIAKTQPNSP